MDAASPALTSGTRRKSSVKSPAQPAPPEAMTGTLTASHTASSMGRSKPPLTPSVSMEFTTTSPAPIPTQRFIQPMASMPVSSLPPRAKTRNCPSTRFMSAESTTHWSP